MRARERGDLSYEWFFSTTYSSQYKVIHKLLNKHWGILENDEVLDLVLLAGPNVIFKKAPALRHFVAPNVIEPPVRPTLFSNMHGFYTYQRCPICRSCGLNTRRTQTFESTVTGRIYEIEGFVTCSTRNVTNLLECSCGLQYVG